MGHNRFYCSLSRGWTPLVPLRRVVTDARTKPTAGGPTPHSHGTPSIAEKQNLRNRRNGPEDSTPQQPGRTAEEQRHPPPLPTPHPPRAPLPSPSLSSICSLSSWSSTKAVVGHSKTKKLPISSFPRRPQLLPTPRSPSTTLSSSM